MVQIVEVTLDIPPKEQGDTAPFVGGAEHILFQVQTPQTIFGPNTHISSGGHSNRFSYYSLIPDEGVAGLAAHLHGGGLRSPRLLLRTNSPSFPYQERDNPRRMGKSVGTFPDCQGGRSRTVRWRGSLAGELTHLFIVRSSLDGSYANFLAGIRSRE
eukprot:Gb_38513 [translate_table: standard]